MAPIVCVYIAASLDGFIARTDGGLDWLGRVESPGEDYGYGRFIDSIDAMVMGRNTYDAVLGFEAWPYEGKRCVVMTHRPCDPTHGEACFSGEPAELLHQLARAGVRRVYVDGGRVVSAFLDAGLVDELTVSVIPVLLGDGVRLFAQSARSWGLTLEESRAFTSGLVQLRYRVCRDDAA